MEKNTDEELYVRAVQAILNEARDEMIASASSPTSLANQETETRLQAIRRKLGI